MRNNYLYYFFYQAVPKHICENIIRHFTQSVPKKGEIGYGTENNQNIDHEIRDSDVIFCEDEWSFKLFKPFIEEANKKAGWNYVLNKQENPQFTIYGKNQHYDWHTDDSVNDKDVKRKLSASIILSNPNDYTGGDFLFYSYNPKERRPVVKSKEAKGQGSVIVFPSYMWHKVMPVTQGVRYSMVNWVEGPMFK